MSYLAGIITYNPDICRLSACLNAVLNQMDVVIINDNGSDNIIEIKRLTDISDRIILIENDKNLGMAKALNIIFKEACIRNIKWVLTLDQDTIIPDNMMNVYRKYINGSKDCAVVCPQIYDDITKRRWPILKDGQNFEYVERCITSGSINRTDAWVEVGGFDEALFIDEVDHDYCLQLKSIGKKIMLTTEVVINHQIGNTKVYRICGNNIYVRNHSAFRKYYIVRNIIYMSRKYNNKVLLKDYVHVIAFVLKTLIFEDNKLQKMQSCFKGVKDGIIGNMG